MENENCVLKEEIVSLKEDIQLKNTAQEASICKVNDLEESLTRQTKRIKILEEIVNKYLSSQGMVKPTLTIKEEN